MSMSFPSPDCLAESKNHSVTTDLDLYWPPATPGGTEHHRLQQHHPGPRQSDSMTGPEFYVILLDNGRTNLLAQTEQRRR
jgi:L-lactate dehydrogenase complex protein LldF